MKFQELVKAKEVDVLIKKRGWPTRRLSGTIATIEEITKHKDGAETKVEVKRISRDTNKQLFAIIQTAKGFMFARPWNIKSSTKLEKGKLN